MANAPDPKSITNARVKRTEAYAEKVRQLFAATVNEIIALNKTLPDPASGIMYSFDGDSKKVQAKVEMLLRRLHSVVTLAIQKGISVEWEQANVECDRLVKSAYGRDLLGSPIMRGWQKRNNAAKQAFINRSDNGMNLSDRVWRSVRQLRDEMEIAITVSIGEGQDAQSMSRNIRKYLNDPDLMFRRFRYQEKEPVLDDKGNAILDKHGKPMMQAKLGSDGRPIWRKKWKKRIADPANPGRYKWIDYDRDSYIPIGAGKNSRGVYKSAAKNAMRVARTETNIAYRRADHERWQQMDFVLGQRVHLSRNHPKKDICDKLAGDYPKDFVFDGWHPQCFCYVTPILVDASEMQKANEAFLRGEEYKPKGKRVYDYPQQFKDYITENEDNIFDKNRSNPYFIDNNQAVVAKILRGDEFTDDDLPIMAADEDAAEPQQLTIQQMADIRHSMRTEVEENDIRERWKQHQEELRKTKLVADNVLSVAANYGDVDFSELQSAVDDGNYTRMRQLAKDVAQQILAAKKFEQSISDLIPNAHTLHQTYSKQALQDAYGELDGVMNKWLSKYGYSSIDAAPLEHLRNKLDFELTNPSISYSQKEIIKNAIIEKIRVVEQKIKWNDMISKATSLRSFSTKSPVYKRILIDIDVAINNGDFTGLQNGIDAAEAQQQKITEQRIKRSGDTNTALNKEYIGSVVGKDISASVDVRVMTSEDPYNSSSFTNNVARMQGFDSPAKLVTDKEFVVLEKACGEVFYRTVNPTTFKGIKMSSEEFASQLYTADRLELNGPGGRVYGDGMYVATSSWDGYKTNGLTASNKKDAYISSVCYGDGSHTIYEMTFVRVPKIITQRDLQSMWSKLSRDRQAAFGYNENTYACALGYDAMYCDGPNYMVIWNRSIIAVKKK